MGELELERKYDVKEMTEEKVKFPDARQSRIKRIRNDG